MATAICGVMFAASNVASVAGLDLKSAGCNVIGSISEIVAPDAEVCEGQTNTTSKCSSEVVIYLYVAFGVIGLCIVLGVTILFVKICKKNGSTPSGNNGKFAAVLKGGIIGGPFGAAYAAGRMLRDEKVQNAKLGAQLLTNNEVHSEGHAATMDLFGM